MCALIRKEKIEEHRAVENLVRESFWNVYRPGCLEHYLLHVMRNNESFIPKLDFVMEKDGELIGQIVYAHANIITEDGKNFPILTMGPISISPAYQRKGYGKQLLDYSLEKATELGHGAVCFEGNIDFYGKSGFTQASKFGISYPGFPKDAEVPFFLCKELIPNYLRNINGTYSPPKFYNVDEKEADIFDKEFPPKEKLKLPGQIFQ